MTDSKENMDAQEKRIKELAEDIDPSEDISPDSLGKQLPHRLMMMLLVGLLRKMTSKNEIL